MAEDTMLQEAIEALRQGERARAKDLLTRLIKADQDNPTYWTWMSATVETSKERIYCLQTVLRLDPENAAAKRGLVLLGALPPDETVQPFPLNRPRLWEEQIALTSEAQKPRGFKALIASPLARLVSLMMIGVMVCALAVFGLTARGRQFGLPLLATFGPSPTFTTTPTYIPATPALRTPTPTFVGPTPLWMLLPATYTPTPLYVSTPRQAEARDVFRAAEAAYANQDWQSVLLYMQQVATLEPNAADPYYFIGEAYRFMGDYRQAFDAYERATAIDPNFGPAYLGKARVIPRLNPGANILPNLDRAIEKDANFAEAYLDRAAYYMAKRNYQVALADLLTARDLAPESALVHLYLAQTYLAMERNAEALEAAQKANALDLTLLPAYLALGQAYEANAQVDKAVGPLQTYMLYQAEDAEAIASLGGAYYTAGDYERALAVLTEAIRLGRVGKAYLYRGLTYLALGDGNLAEADLRSAAIYFPASFEVSVGLTRAFILQGHYGDAYVQIDGSKHLVEKDSQMAQFYYWRAISLEHSNNLPAAYKDWQALLALPPSAAAPEMRAEALQRMAAISTPTLSPTLSGKAKTPMVTPTPAARKTPTATRTP